MTMQRELWASSRTKPRAVHRDAASTMTYGGKCGCCADSKHPSSWLTSAWWQRYGRHHTYAVKRKDKNGGKKTNNKNPTKPQDPDDVIRLGNRETHSSSHLAFSAILWKSPHMRHDTRIILSKWVSAFAGCETLQVGRSNTSARLSNTVSRKYYFS